MARRYNARSAVPITLRSHDQAARFFDGMGMVDSGLAPLVHWLDPGRADVGEAGGLIGHSGIGRKTGI
jgi:S-adenosyl methyltransferase